MTETMTWDERRAALQGAFTPAKPVRNQELFAGRTEQLIRVIDSLQSPGEHAAIFGERGVGKTSLAAIAEAAGTLSGRRCIRFNCQAQDDPADIWRRTGTTIGRRLNVDRAAGRDTTTWEGPAASAIDLLSGVAPSEHDFLTALEMLTVSGPVVVFLDEFDRLGDSYVHSALVDMMKTVADIDIDVTFVIVGVASTVDGLIDEHSSIGRGLNQIEMPRMSIVELVDVLSRGLAQAEMSVSVDAANFMARLSMGLPHYTHLLGLNSGLSAIESRDEVVDVDHVQQSLPAALSRAEQHVRELYYDATHSTQSNIYQEVLLAAALVRGDDRGYFAPGDLRAPLSAILQRPVAIPQFARHLGQFVDTRGPALEKSSAQSRPRYRFTEPLLVPYVAMRGMESQLISQQDLLRLI